MAVGIWFQIWRAAEEKARRPKSVSAIMFVYKIQSKVKLLLKWTLVCFRYQGCLLLLLLAIIKVIYDNNSVLLSLLYTIIYYYRGRAIVCFFVSLLARLRENGWTDLHEIFREGVEWPRDDLITFLVNSEKPRDAAMCNAGAGFVVLLHHSLLSFCNGTKGLICYLHV